jgi:hypothetical protein
MAVLGGPAVMLAMVANPLLNLQILMILSPWKLQIPIVLGRKLHL